MDIQGNRVTVRTDEIGRLAEVAEALEQRARERTPAVETLPLEGIEEPEMFQGYRIVATTAHITGGLDSGIPKDLEVGQTVRLTIDGRVSGVKFKEF